MSKSLPQQNDWEYRIQVRQIDSGEWVDVVDPHEDREEVQRYADDLKRLHRDDPGRVRIERRRVGPWESA